MLKLFDSSGETLGYITAYRDLCIESDLSNGDKSLSFVLLSSKAGDVQNESYIETEDERFVIKESGISSDGFPEFKCQLDLEDLERSMFEQFTAADKTLTEAANLALAGTGWRVSTSITKKRSVQTFKATPLTALGKIKDAWMCEIRYDTKNKVVYFEEQFGSDKGVYFLRGLNLKNLDLTVDSYDYYTRLIPIGKDGLKITEVNGGKEYVENYQYSSKIRTLIWEDTSYEDAQELMADAIKKLSDLSKPKKSYSADVRDLASYSQDYSVMEYALGDTVTLIDEVTGIRDKQRIVKLTVYPDEPLKNTCELSNTVLTFEQMQDKLDAAAAAWENVSNKDGTIKGVYVHGVEADGIVGIETTINNSSSVRQLQSDVSTNTQSIGVVVQDLTAVTARVGTLETTTLKATDAQLMYATIANLTATNETVHSLQGDYADFKSATTQDLSAHQAVIDSLSTTYATIASLTAVGARIDNLGATYATIDLANVEDGSITTAMIGTGVVGTAQIADSSITDAKIVGLTASKITAGRLDAGVIDVVNLNADNITVGTINGQRIASGAIDETKLSQTLADTIDNAESAAVSAQSQVSELQPELISGTHGSSTTPTWTGTSTRLKSITKGTVIRFMMTSAGATNVTLNLTLATGSKTGTRPVYYRGTTRLSTQYPSGSVISLIYNGSSWYVLNPYTDTDINTIGVLAGPVTAGESRILSLTLIMRDTATTWVSVTTDSGVGTAKSPFTGGLYPDRILFSNTTTIVNAGATCQNCYEALAVDLRYSSNCGQTLTAGLPVYFVGTIGNDGLFYLDDEWYTQTEPDEEDGKTYIYLGLAYSTYRIYLVEKNPLMQYYNGQFLSIEDIAKLKAENAQYTADGKNAVFYQSIEPSGTGRKINDVWFDSANDNRMYYWDGMQWAIRPFGTNAIAENAITANLIAADAVTADKIVARSITAAKIAANTITANEIAAGTITATQISAGTITATEIASGTITAAQIASGTITATQIAAGTITGTQIAASTIKATNIDVTDLFAQNITASGTITGVTLSGATGSFTGSVTASSGKIGKYDITSTYLKTGTGTSATGIGGNQAFWAGNESSDAAPFRVSYGGALVATNASITGDITASSLTAKNTYYIHNSAGTKKDALSAPDGSFGSSLAIGNGFSACYLHGNVMTGGSLTVLEDGTGSINCGLINSNNTIQTSGSIKSGRTDSGGSGAIHAISPSRNVALHANAAGNAGVYDPGNSAWIMVSGSNQDVTIPHRLYANVLAVSTGAASAAGVIQISNTGAYEASYALQNGSRAGKVIVDASGNVGLYDTTNRKYLIYSPPSQGLILPQNTYIHGYLNAYAIDNQNARYCVVTGSNGYRISRIWANSATQMKVATETGTTGTYSTLTVTMASSDIRLKENVKDTIVKDALSVIKKIPVRSFRWKGGDYQKIGFVADELEKIDPKLAAGGGYDEDGRMIVKSVDVFYLLGYLTKAVQELSEKLKAS